MSSIEGDVADTSNRAESWRDAMHKTSDVIAHGRERFDNGGFIEKRDVLLALGTYPTLDNGIVELMPFEWLIPIAEGLPELNAEIEKVQSQDLQIGNPELEHVRTKWLGKRDLFQTFPDEVLTDDENMRDISEITRLLNN